MVLSLYKWLWVSLVCLLPAGAAHPFHVSVTEIAHNAGEKTLEVSCKLFTDDFERALATAYRAKVDLVNPPSRAAMDTLVKKYVFSHLTLRANDRPCTFRYLGFEHDKESVYAYVEVEGIPALRALSLTNSLMYDVFDDQVNIMHVVVGGDRKSTRVSYPEKEASFSW